jgi:predicted transcriptional regulator
VIHSLSSLVDRKILRKTGRGVYTKVKESDGEKLLPIQREVMSNLEKPMSVSQLNRRVKANYKTLLWNIWKLRDEGYVESTGTSTEYEFTRKGKKMADGMEEILKIVTEYASSKIL